MHTRKFLRRQSVPELFIGHPAFPCLLFLYPIIAQKFPIPAAPLSFLLQGFLQSMLIVFLYRIDHKDSFYFFTKCPLLLLKFSAAFQELRMLFPDFMKFPCLFLSLFFLLPLLCCRHEQQQDSGRRQHKPRDQRSPCKRRDPGQ